MTVSLNVFTLLAISVDRRKVNLFSGILHKTTKSLKRESLSSLKLLLQYIPRNHASNVKCNIPFQAIIRPLSPKSGKMSVLLVILSIWTVSGIMAAPAGYFSQQVDIRK